VIAALRPPRSEDRDGLDDMWSRCSVATRHARFFAPVPTMPSVYLEHVLTQPDQSMVATAGGELIAVASLVHNPDGRAELAVLVEDRWQRIRLGPRLVAALLRAESARQIDSVYASVLVGNEAALSIFHRYFDVHEVQYSWDELTLAGTVKRIWQARPELSQSDTGIAASSPKNPVNSSGGRARL
jgi:hypothetical protein